MATFRYRAKDMQGRVFAGELEADSAEVCYRMLRDRGQFCVSLNRAGGSSLDVPLGRRALRTRELFVFCRQFSTMLNAGVPVIRCLDVLYQQATKKRMRQVLLDVYEAVQRGESLSEAMKRRQDAFPELLLSMVAAGEASGTLDGVMARMADQFERESKIQNKVRQSVVYPIFLIFMSVAVVIFLLTYILPTFLNMYKEFHGQVPAVTRFLMALSDGLTHYWYAVLIGVAALVLGVRMVLKSPPVRLGWDKLKLRMPVLGKILTTLESARFSRTLSSLFGSGLPIIQAIEIVARVVRNAYIKQSLAQAGEDIRRGVSISTALSRRNVFPAMLTSMVRIGEESGNMDEILGKTSAFYDDEAASAIQRLVSLIEPIMIVLLAVVVGFIIISVVAPIFGIYNSIGTSS